MRKVSLTTVRYTRPGYFYKTFKFIKQMPEIPSFKFLFVCAIVLAIVALILWVMAIFHVSGIEYAIALNIAQCFFIGIVAIKAYRK